MTVVAVTGASGMLGRAVLSQLAGDPGVERIIGVDTAEPSVPVAKLDMRLTGLHDPRLPRALEGADVVVHLPAEAPAGATSDVRFDLAVNGTREVLAAVDKVGAGMLVHVSTAAVYGAHPDNPLPLTEASPARANPDFTPGSHHLLAEEFVGQWSGDHPGVTTVVLRPAAVLGPGQDDVLSRYLESPRLPVIAGCAPPMQFVHVDDLAAAVHEAIGGDLSGVYNVAADGWLPHGELSAVLGRRTVAVPEGVAFWLAGQLWRLGLLAVPPGGLHFVMHPCVVANDRLRATGWAPACSNREVLREFAAAHRDYVSLGRVRLRRRAVYVGVAGGTGTVAGAGLVLRRRWKRRRAGDE